MYENGLHSPARKYCRTLRRLFFSMLESRHHPNQLLPKGMAKPRTPDSAFLALPSRRHELHNECVGVAAQLGLDDVRCHWEVP